jgi:two-component system sensor histidine kinase RpfC
MVRLAIACLIVAYLYYLGRRPVGIDSSYSLMLQVMSVEAAIGLALLAGIVASPGVSHVRRAIGMFSDYATLLILMLIKPKDLAPLYVIILWVTIGNGLRFGTRYLLCASAIGAAAFSIVIVNADYWRSQLYLSVGLAVGLVAIPAYLSRLLMDLRRKTEDARRANEAKSRFLATMSHEFRSPLNGIIGMSELLKGGQMTAEQKDCTDVIYTSAQTLLLLVEEVLNISAIEAGKLQKKPVDFNLREVVQRVEKMLQPPAAAKGLVLRVTLAPDVPLELHGDAAHLIQILLNLLHNAVKFTESGSVSLDVVRGAASREGIRIAFSVRDTGIGIPDEYKKKVFEAFEQVDTGPARRFGGTGLGTTIAKTLTQSLGGVLVLEDNPGGGCHFHFEIPFVEHVSEAGEAQVVPNNVVAFDDPFVRHKARTKSLRALVADDLQANRTVLTKLLERAGHKVTAVGDGDQALDALSAEDFDFVVLDMHMPNVSGLDVIRQLRFMQAGRAERTPVIVLSADATEQAAKEAAHAGAQVFLTKPVVVPKLLEAIVDVTTQSTQKTPQSRISIEQQTAFSMNADVLDELAAMGLGQPFMKEFADQCVRDIGTCLINLGKHAASRDWNEFRDAAHAMKGVSENLGVSSIAERCRLIMRSDDATLAKKHSAWLNEISLSTDLLAQHVQRELDRIFARHSDAGHRPAPDVS